MKKLFNQLSQKKVTILSIIIAIVGDLLIFSYIYHRFSQGKDLFIKLLKTTFEQQKLDFSVVDQNFIREQFELYCHLLALALILLFIFHLVIYTLHFFRKKIGRLYLHIYAITAAVGCFFMALTMILTTPLCAFLFLIQSTGYLFIVIGLRRFRVES